MHFFCEQKAVIPRNVSLVLPKFHARWHYKNSDSYTQLFLFPWICIKCVFRIKDSFIICTISGGNLCSLFFLYPFLNLPYVFTTGFQCLFFLSSESVGKVRKVTEEGHSAGAQKTWTVYSCQRAGGTCSFQRWEARPALHSWEEGGL